MSGLHPDGDGQGRGCDENSANERDVLTPRLAASGTAAGGGVRLGVRRRLLAAQVQKSPPESPLSGCDHVRLIEVNHGGVSFTVTNFPFAASAPQSHHRQRLGVAGLKRLPREGSARNRLLRAVWSLGVAYTARGLVSDGPNRRSIP